MDVTRTYAHNRPHTRIASHAYTSGVVPYPQAARDVTRVPEIAALRGTGSGGGRFGLASDKEAVRAAVEAADRLAVTPAVERCAAEVQALDAAGSVARLRERAEAAAAEVLAEFTSTTGAYALCCVVLYFVHACVRGCGRMLEHGLSI